MALNPNDIIYTPKSVAITMIKLCKIKKDSKVLDPSKGGGVFYDNLPTNCIKDYCEITENKDFYEYNENVDIIIGNPPFSQWKKWLEHTVKLNPKKICYIMGVLNITPKRIDFLKKHGYFLSKFHITTVKNWFGNTLCVIFDKLGNECITYDIERR